MLLLKWSSMEVKHRLLNFSNKVIYQNDDWFLFSLDSLLLANFVTLRKSDKKILDLCTGNAPVAMFLAMKSKASIVGIELQKEIYDLGEKSVIENAMDKQITLINDDIRNISKYYETDSFDVITCNPPYFKVNDTKMINDNKIKSIARHEIMCNLDSILEISKKMLRTGGVIALVYPVSRLIEIIYKMKENNIKWVFVGGVDNILLKIVDPLLLGITVSENNKIASKSVIKTNPKERAGVFCKIDGRPGIIEYSELPEEMAEEVDEHGDLVYGDLNILSHLYNIEALDELSSKVLPYHIAEKKSNYLDENGNLVEPEGKNVYKFESFIFDAFSNYEDISILRVKREEEFAPIKNKEGNDSPETAIKLYNNRI